MPDTACTLSADLPPRQAGQQGEGVIFQLYMRRVCNNLKDAARSRNAARRAAEDANPPSAAQVLVSSVYCTQSLLTSSGWTSVLPTA